MSKKTFIALADVVKRLQPKDTDVKGASEEEIDQHVGRCRQWTAMRDALADFCAQQNRNFMRERWLGYVAGECGPNGGAVASKGVGK